MNLIDIDTNSVSADADPFRKQKGQSRKKRAGHFECLVVFDYANPTTTDEFDHVSLLIRLCPEKRPCD